MIQQKLMRTFIFLVSLFLFSCKNEIHISGIVVDQTTKMPLENVLVTTIRSVNAARMDFAETRTKNGRFAISFSSQNNRSNEIMVELSKEGYLTNVYSCFQDKPNDTLYLVRQFKQPYPLLYP